MDSLSSSQLSGLKSEELMDQIRQQLAIANAQLVIQKMTEKCFTKCISKPGSSLDNSEQKCVAMCMDRYMDAHGVVSTAYLNRLRQ
ncbi:mitochondrial import inner membrane translocase subunit Tim13-B [Thrips palmi]|uniref:Mitochondrial import inner membrane translocase subunit n=1 Tax=Thrips palmi TaxID=161013 RepID=A0A6P8Z3X2_THRPL|nr:mitochondrial import inner membrane translocase subunit Tim13-B [Thrips palmi]